MHTELSAAKTLDGGVCHLIMDEGDLSMSITQTCSLYIMLTGLFEIVGVISKK
jgi:hypothetical protein